MLKVGVTVVSRYGNGQGRGLARLPGIDALEIRCGMSNVGWAGPATEARHRVIISRSGGYLRRVNGTVTFADATSLLVTRPGDEISVAHPVGPGDTFTQLVLDEDQVARLGDDGYPIPSGELIIDDRFDLAHRSFVSACRRGIDGVEAAERLHWVLATLPCDPGGRAMSDRRRPATILAHRRLVNDVRERLADGELAGGLDEIAAAVCASPHHLSRIFRRVTGETITAYRNRLRVRAVLTEIQDGAVSLRMLAARYGFADQAHLTRVVRRQLGVAPSSLRPLLQPGPNLQRRGGGADN